MASTSSRWTSGASTMPSRREQQFNAVGMEHHDRADGQLAHILNEKYFDAACAASSGPRR